ATGAAALAFESVGREFAAEARTGSGASSFTGLAFYRDSWRGLAADRGVADAAAGGAR
ncbi:MAG: carbohydrate kinase, partial [Mesorhizobium sp.]